MAKQWNRCSGDLRIKLKLNDRTGKYTAIMSVPGGARCTVKGIGASPHLQRTRASDSPKVLSHIAQAAIAFGGEVCKQFDPSEHADSNQAGNGYAINYCREGRRPRR